MGATLACPFGPICSAQLEPIGQLKSVGSTEIEYVYPPHTIVGPESRYGQCPASHVQIVGWPKAVSLTDYAKGVLRDARETWAKDSERALPADATPAPDSSARKDVSAKTTSKRPTIGDPVDNSRDQLKNMIQMTKSAIERAQGNISAMLDLIEDLSAKGVICQTQSDAALSLARAAVGGDNLPDPAHRMLGELTNANAMCHPDRGEVMPIISAARGMLNSLLATYTAAAEAADDYLRLP